MTSERAADRATRARSADWGAASGLLIAAVAIAAIGVLGAHPSWAVSRVFGYLLTVGVTALLAYTVVRRKFAPITKRRAWLSATYGVAILLVVVAFSRSTFAAEGPWAGLREVGPFIPIVLYFWCLAILSPRPE